MTLTPQQKIAERLYELLPHNADIPEIIRLADILLAISKVSNEKNNDRVVKYPLFETFMMVFTSKQKDGFYNLEKDNILYQSDEFCEFLLELLK
jgi:hypothetical protein